MNTEPITHLVIDTSSSNEDYNGDCDFCLVPVMTPGYVSYLLAYMDEVRRMRGYHDFGVVLQDLCAIRVEIPFTWLRGIISSLPEHARLSAGHCRRDGCVEALSSARLKMCRSRKPA